MISQANLKPVEFDNFKNWLKSKMIVGENVCILYFYGDHDGFIRGKIVSLHNSLFYIADWKDNRMSYSYDLFFENIEHEFHILILDADINAHIFVSKGHFVKMWFGWRCTSLVMQYENGECDEIENITAFHKDTTTLLQLKSISMEAKSKPVKIYCQLIKDHVGDAFFRIEFLGYMHLMIFDV